MVLSEVDSDGPVRLLLHLHPWLVQHVQLREVGPLGGGENQRVPATWGRGLYTPAARGEILGL